MNAQCACRRPHPRMPRCGHQYPRGPAIPGSPRTCACQHPRRCQSAARESARAPPGQPCPRGSGGGGRPAGRCRRAASQTTHHQCSRRCSCGGSSMEGASAQGGLRSEQGAALGAQRSGALRRQPADSHPAAARPSSTRRSAMSLINCSSMLVRKAFHLRKVEEAGVWDPEDSAGRCLQLLDAAQALRPVASCDPRATCASIATCVL